MLWQYALAYHVLKKEEYKIAVDKIVRCLDETFEPDGLYVSGHDADTDHVEGATYLWTYKEIAGILTPRRIDAF